MFGEGCGASSGPGDFVNDWDRDSPPAVPGLPLISSGLGSPAPTRRHPGIAGASREASKWLGPATTSPRQSTSVRRSSRAVS